MNISPDKQTLEDAAGELGVDASFIEKDWYAVQVLKALAAFSHPEITPVFAGGTSLSKGYGLLKRFSEDLDFRTHYKSDKPSGKGERRRFRGLILEAIKKVDGIAFDEGRMEVGSNYFKLPMTYEGQFEIPTSLRPDLQIEFSYTQPRRDLEIRPIATIISELAATSPEFDIPCLACLETAADKFSALIWRVKKRDRKSTADDPAMVRHLHDLYALKEIVSQQPDEFYRLVNESFDEDMKSGPRRLEKGLVEACADALEMLQKDSLYRDEYTRFVAKVSYADSDEVIEFDDALNQFEAVAKMCKD